jgi:nicotinamide mononucleotide adenylyltransferase
MKTFRHIVTEATKAKSRVILFGRMNPITRGHEENVDAAHKIAQKHGADLHVIASHSHDAKKNPLSAEQKTLHMKRAFGHLSNTELKTSSKEAPTILHHAAQAHAAGVKHLIIAGGGDRASGYHKLLHDYNGVKGKAHGHYHFDKISIENTGERKEGVSGTDMRKHASGGHFDKFRAGLPSKIAKNEKLQTTILTF